jgi:hypothetical protein
MKCAALADGPSKLGEAMSLPQSFKAGRLPMDVSVVRGSETHIILERWLLDHHQIWVMDSGP